MTSSALTEGLLYRRDLIALPLQQSMFSEVHTATELLCPWDVVGDGQRCAWLNERGDLFVDWRQLFELTDSLESWSSPAWGARMEAELRRRQEDVVAAIAQVEASRGPIPEGEVGSRIATLSRSIAGLVPCGLLSKCLPDALLRLSEASGNQGGPIPLRSPSAGSILSGGLTRLARRCKAHGYPPGRLTAEWPAVPATLVSAVESFCRQHEGYGPLTWEAAGYEDPQYVIEMLEVVFEDGDLDAIRTDGRGGGPADAASPDASWQHRLLASWLHFLDYETFYVRRAFYRGFLPLLRDLAPSVRAVRPSMRPASVLFLKADELMGGIGRDELDRALDRRAHYEGNESYFAKHGIQPPRLDALMEPVQ